MGSGILTFFFLCKCNKYVNNTWTLRHYCLLYISYNSLVVDLWHVLVECYGRTVCI
jgi:hypothetical protein